MLDAFRVSLKHVIIVFMAVVRVSMAVAAQIGEDINADDVTGTRESSERNLGRAIDFYQINLEAITLHVLCMRCLGDVQAFHVAGRAIGHPLDSRFQRGNTSTTRIRRLRE